MARIAIIGSGIAGLSCATMLHRAGLEVSLFDKARSPGGRMSTRRGDDWQCDHGAQYFTARHPEFRAEVARWQQAGVADLWAPRLWRFDGDSREHRASTVERFVGTPAMTAPARYLAFTCARRLPGGVSFKLIWGKGVSTPSGVTSSAGRELDYRVRDPFKAEMNCERENAKAEIGRAHV